MSSVSASIVMKPAADMSFDFAVPSEEGYTVFLEREAVTVTFSVTPVAIDDTYDITVEADFETVSLFTPKCQT